MTIREREEQMFKGVVAIKPLLFFDISYWINPTSGHPTSGHPTSGHPIHPTCRINLYLVSFVSMIPPH